MLFNTYIFIFAFLPIVWGVYQLLSRFDKPRTRLVWLLIASLFFYGCWKPEYLALLIGSIGFNYIVGVCLSRYQSKAILAFGIVINLLVLAYFKYADFFLNTASDFGLGSFDALEIILPLAISFFTFQQIAFLVDVYKGVTSEKKLLNFGAFVAFFPQLIAGPIVHHKQLASQFFNFLGMFTPSRYIAMGLTLFSIGLFKKVVLADTLAVSSNSLHHAAYTGAAFSHIDSLIGIVAFSFQIYFDFSGYSDMAIGIALLFGIVLPINFLSPYKASGFSDFWRRWHITLSNFLRDYIYIPLGGNRRGKFVQYSTILCTMLLGGLWHGAGWTFVCWGGLHGAFIVMSHVGRNMGHHMQKYWVLRIFRTGIMFCILTLLWVLFRAESWDAALNIYASLFDLSPSKSLNLMQDKKTLIALILSGIVVWVLPNSMEFIGVHDKEDTKDQPDLSLLSKTLSLCGMKELMRWKATAIHAVWVSCLFVMTLILMRSTLFQEFIYFDF